MKADEVRQILANKFKDEFCQFTKKDIIVKQKKNGFNIHIKDYEHIIFNVAMRKPDELFDYGVMITNNFDDDYIFIESKKDYELKEALIELGYYIASRF